MAPAVVKPVIVAEKMTQGFVRCANRAWRNVIMSPIDAPDDVRVLDVEVITRRGVGGHVFQRVGSLAGQSSEPGPTNRVGGLSWRWRWSCGQADIASCRRTTRRPRDLSRAQKSVRHTVSGAPRPMISNTGGWSRSPMSS